MKIYDAKNQELLDLVSISVEKFYQIIQILARNPVNSMAQRLACNLVVNLGYDSISEFLCIHDER